MYEMTFFTTVLGSLRLSGTTQTLQCLFDLTLDFFFGQFNLRLILALIP